MAKTTAPLISFEARGKVASQQIYQRSKSRNIAKSYAAPKNPQSAAQVADRAYVTTAVKSWRSYFQNAAVLEAWDRSSNQGKRTTTGYNKAIGAFKTSLKDVAAPAFQSAAHSKAGSIYSVPMINAADGTVAAETGHFEVWVGSKPTSLKYHSLGRLSGGALSFPESPCPPVTSGFLLWLDASQIAGYANGQEMTTWLDMGSTGKTYSRAGAGNGCHFYTTGAGSRPYCYFNGVQDHMYSAPWLKSMTGIDVYAVYSALPTGNPQHILSQGHAAGGFYGNRIFYVPAAGTSQVNMFFNGAVYQGGAGANGTVHGTPHIARYALDALGGQAFVNGIPGANVPACYPMQDTPLSTQCIIGVPFDDWWGEPFKGNIYEIIVYDHRLTDSEAASVTSYLAHKYEIQGALQVPTIWQYFQIIKNGKRRSGIIKA